mmetsp:Transcript_5960/g.7865  ORF Transcript_5960/g.7865 Transcript_5960/m.7865 type:complete len:593 (-) Transcript_5960:157-1935(-)
MGCSSSNQAFENDTGATNLESNVFSQADLAASAVAGDASMTSRLFLSISCKELKNTDTGSLSDTFAVISLRSKIGGPWNEIGRTEIIANCLNPQWVQMIPITYRFEEVQPICISVYNVAGDFESCDAASLDLNKQKFQGSAETTLAQIVGGYQQTWNTQLQNKDLPDQNSTLTVKVEEIANQNSNIHLKLSGDGILVGSKIFLRFSYLNEAQLFFPCYKTEVQFTPKSPKWAVIDGSLQNFVNGDVHRPLLIECQNYKKNGGHVIIGTAQTSVDNMMQVAKQNTSITLRKDSDVVGHLVVDECQITHLPTFFEYIKSGTKLAFIAGIDFTASNGDPMSADSLHHIDPNGNLNEYASAITGIGRILEHYDDDNLFPVYGYGAKESRNSATDHCFAVNANEADPNCMGVQGILDAYHACLNRVILHGPTLFAPLINNCAAIARSTLTNDPSNQTYYVLLILTDGIINDMENTTQAIVEASDLPLSIIIIGVGNADFTAMEILDGDEERLHTQDGKYAQRDIVQFVPMRKFQNADSYMIAKEVLDEVPRQLVDYMSAKNICPVREPANQTPFCTTQFAQSKDTTDAIPIAQPIYG